MGCVGIVAFHKCRFIPPHQSLARQLPPEGKPLHPLHFSQQDGRVEIRKLGCFCNSACFLIFCLLPEIVFTMFARAYKRLPLGGKLSRKRLMRGDKFTLPIGMYLRFEAERRMGRSLQHRIFDGLCLTASALCRVLTRRERPACRSAPIIN